MKKKKTKKKEREKKKKKYYLLNSEIVLTSFKLGVLIVFFHTFCNEISLTLLVGNSEIDICTCVKKTQRSV